MFSLPELPYAMDALAPSMSAETLEFHFGKHHKAYVDKLNELISGTPLEGLPLEDVIRKSADDPALAQLFNQAGQHWNHTHFWMGMRPGGGGAMPGHLEKRLITDFGSIEAFRAEFAQACLTQFGSGWGWLVFDGDKLSVTKTPNAETPITEGHAALLTCDVWEHSYYIDHRNQRPKYVETFLNDLVDWQVVADRLEAVTG
ncbi:superoxide dismutase [Pontibaca salina]|uniref:Superoxide dismutase n=1 Tax=Pontibaca salina TaxID=2795731 RepID=A0A934HSK3_9RHOB|nr:superoxide dismutase [Pontibaca salina]MBI6630096.1 superoxide dismutase [Pontibaca salina]